MKSVRTEFYIYHYRLMENVDFHLVNRIIDFYDEIDTITGIVGDNTYMPFNILSKEIFK